MAERTVSRHTRIYANGYDISGNSRSIGSLDWEYSEDDQTCILDAVKGALPSKATLGIGTLNGILDSTATTGLHALFSTAGVAKKIMIPVGIGAAPAIGNPVWCGEFTEKNYKSDIEMDSIAINSDFGLPSVTAGMNYEQPWGKLLHAYASRTAASTTKDGLNNNGAASALGGWMMYQIFSITGAGTATVSIDDSADNVTYGALSGATSGAIATASAPVAGIVQLGKTDAVKQYLRWQIAFGGSATACVFALAFIRGDR